MPEPSAMDQVEPPWETSPVRVVFGDFELDFGTHELTRAGEEIPVEPQVLAVLCYLVEHRDRVVTKNELLDNIWGDRFVSESALTSRIRDARKAVDDDGRQQQRIKTIHGTGYRFVAEAEEAAAESRGATPVPGPAIFGRQSDVDRVLACLEEARLVSIVGPGGIGKTHLLTEVMARVGTHFDEAVLVELALLDDDTGLPSLVLDALGAVERPKRTPADSAVDHIGDRRVLIAFDNAEHVRRPLADWARTLLRRCPNVQILATSQERLHVVGEALHPLGSLDPEASKELFLAAARRAGVDLDPHAPELTQLCERLDGIPLAIELAAARARLLSLDDVHANIEHHLSTAAGAGPERHASVEAALGWSLDALPDADRSLLEDLSVFTGPFDMAAAAAVSSSPDITSSLLDLCDRSLVVAMPGQRTSWFRLLEPVRWFAARKHADMSGARQAHAALFVDRARAHQALLHEGHLDEGFSAMRDDWPNLRAAMQHLQQGTDVASATSLVNAVATYGEVRFVSEVRTWAEATLAAVTEAGADPDPDLVANVARMAGHGGDLERAAQLMDELPEDASSTRVVMARLAVAHYQADVERASQLSDTALEVIGRTGGFDELGLLMTRVFLAAATGTTDFPSSDRMVAVGKQTGQTGQLFVAFGDAARADWSGDKGAAVDAFDDAITLAETLRLPFLAQSIATYRSIVIVSLDDVARAAQAVGNSLARGLDTGAWALVASDLGIAAKVLVDCGEVAFAAEVLGAREQAGYHLPATDWVAGMMVAVVTEHLGDATERHLAAGAELSLEVAARGAVDRLAQVG